MVAELEATMERVSALKKETSGDSPNAWGAMNEVLSEMEERVRGLMK